MNLLQVGIAVAAISLKFLLLMIPSTLRPFDRIVGLPRYFCFYPTLLAYGSHSERMRQLFGIARLMRKSFIVLRATRGPASNQSTSLRTPLFNGRLQILAQVRQPVGLT